MQVCRGENTLNIHLLWQVLVLILTAQHWGSQNQFIFLDKQILLDR